MSNASTRSAVVTGENVLIPPEPIGRVGHDSAAALVRIDPKVEDALRRRAAAFVADLTTLDPHDEAFERKLESIRTLGQEDIRSAATAANRLLQMPMKAMASGGLAADSNVATSLVELRRRVEELDPSRQGLLETTRRRLLGIIPRGSQLSSYFARYSSGQKQLNAVLESLYRGQDELRKDNAAIEQEKANLWVTMERLRQFAYLALQIDAGVEETIAAMGAEDSERAARLRQDAQFQARQKLQDLMTQLAVSVQGFLAMDLVRRNNVELIKGVDRATTTTVSALRTAIVVAQALANQRLVLGQITALNTTTGNLIESTSEMLRSQSADTYRLAAGATVDVEKLQAAFANIYSAMDSIDGYRLEAIETMRKTVEILGEEVSRAQTYLDRAQSPTRQGELFLS